MSRKIELIDLSSDEEEIRQRPSQNAPPSKKIRAENPAPVINRSSTATTTPSKTVAIRKGPGLPTDVDEIGEDDYPVWFKHRNTDCKEHKFTKRMIGELKKIYNKEGRTDQIKNGVVFRPAQRIIDKDHTFDMVKWHVWLTTDKINPESKLYEGLKSRDLKGVLMECEITEKYPITPPFVRVVHPKLSGGYVFSHGAICFEPLTPKGWPVAMTLTSLFVAIKAIFDYNPVSVVGAGNAETLEIPEYSYKNARQDYQTVLKAHENGATWADMNQMRS